MTGPIGHSKRTSFLLSLDEDLLDQQAIIDPNAIAAAEVAGLRPVRADRSQSHASLLRIRTRFS